MILAKQRAKKTAKTMREAKKKKTTDIGAREGRLKKLEQEAKEAREKAVLAQKLKQDRLAWTSANASVNSLFSQAEPAAPPLWMVGTAARPQRKTGGARTARGMTPTTVGRRGRGGTAGGGHGQSYDSKSRGGAGGGADQSGVAKEARRKAAERCRESRIRNEERKAREERERQNKENMKWQKRDVKLLQVKTGICYMLMNAIDHTGSNVHSFTWNPVRVRAMYLSQSHHRSVRSLTLASLSLPVDVFRHIFLCYALSVVSTTTGAAATAGTGAEQASVEERERRRGKRTRGGTRKGWRGQRPFRPRPIPGGRLAAPPGGPGRGTGGHGAGGGGDTGGGGVR
jgi:hypothetical protein